MHREPQHQQSNWTEQQVAEALSAARNKLQRVRARMHQDGEDLSLTLPDHVTISYAYALKISS